MVVQLEYTFEQQQLRDTARSFLATTADDAVLRGMSGLGLLGLTVPERMGGSGAGMVDLAVVAGEVGRALTAAPFLPSTVISTLMLADLEGERARQLIAGLVEGEIVATVPWHFADSSASSEVRIDSDGILAGGVQHVPEATSADILLLDALDGPGRVLLSVDLSDPSVHIETLNPFDISEPLHTITLDGVRATVLSDDPGRVRRQMLGKLQAVVASELAGIGFAVLDSAIDYAKSRKQFGRAIGSFQAVKHLLADAHIE